MFQLWKKVMQDESKVEVLQPLTSGEMQTGQGVAKEDKHRQEYKMIENKEDKLAEMKVETLVMVRKDKSVKGKGDKIVKDKEDKLAEVKADLEDGVNAFCNLARSFIRPTNYYTELNNTLAKGAEEEKTLKTMRFENEDGEKEQEKWLEEEEECKMKKTLMEKNKVEGTKMEKTLMQDNKVEETKMEKTLMAKNKVGESKMKKTLMQGQKLEETKMEKTIMEEETRQEWDFASVKLRLL